MAQSGVDPGFSEPARTKHGPRSESHTTFAPRSLQGARDLACWLVARLAPSRSVVSLEGHGSLRFR